MTDPVSERPSALKRRARRPLHEAARSAYASTLNDAQREEKNRLRRADVARRARAEAEGLGQGCLAATSGAQPGFPQGGGTKGEGTGNKGGARRARARRPCTCRCLDAQLTRGTLASDGQLTRGHVPVEPRLVLCLEFVKRPHTYTSTTITVMPPP